MKDNWEQKSLGEFITHRKEIIKIEDFHKYKLCRVQTKSLGVVLREEKQGIEIKTKTQQLCKTDDLIFAEMDARFGGFGIIPEELNDSIVSSHYFLYEINQKVIDKIYLSYCLKQPWFLSQVEAKGSTNYAAIRPYQVLSYKIPYPPLSEQKLIVSKIEEVKSRLETINKLRLEQEQEINNLRYSVFLELQQNYASTRIGDVLVSQNRSVTIEPDNIYKQVTVSGNHRGVSLRCLIKGSEIGSKQYLAKKGDFIISKIDARNAAMGMISEELDEALVTGDFPLFGFEDNINPLFFYHFSNTPYFDNACKEASEGTTNRVRIKMDRFYNIQIPIPPIEEQNRIVELLEKMNEIKQTHKEQEAELKQLMPSLLDKAFKGEL